MKFGLRYLMVTTTTSVVGVEEPVLHQLVVLHVIADFEECIIHTPCQGKSISQIQHFLNLELGTLVCEQFLRASLELAMCTVVKKTSGLGIDSSLFSI